MALRENGVQRSHSVLDLDCPAGRRSYLARLFSSQSQDLSRLPGWRRRRSECQEWVSPRNLDGDLAQEEEGDVMFPCPRRIWESFKCTSRQRLRVWRLSHQLWLESRIRVGSAPTLVSSCGGHGKTCAQALQAAGCVLEEWAGMASDERYGVDGAKLRGRLGFALSCNGLDLIWPGRNRCRLVRRRRGLGGRIVEGRAAVTREYPRRWRAGVGGRENPSSTFGYRDFKRPQSGQHSSSLGHGDLV